MRTLSEYLLPFWDNRTIEEMEDYINKHVDLKLLSNLWKNPKFIIEPIGKIIERNDRSYDYADNWFFDENIKKKNHIGGFLLHLEYEEINSEDEKEVCKFTTRPWFIECNANSDQIERTCFKLLEESLKHRLGEFYAWKTEREFDVGKTSLVKKELSCKIHNPHISLNDLIESSNQFLLEEACSDLKKVSVKKEIFTKVYDIMKEESDRSWSTETLYDILIKDEKFQNLKELKSDTDLLVLINMCGKKMWFNQVIEYHGRNFFGVKRSDNEEKTKS